MLFKSFRQFLEEAKKNKEPKPPKPLRSKKEVEKMLDKQGGIGGKAIQRHLEQNPNQEPRTYKLD